MREIVRSRRGILLVDHGTRHEPAQSALAQLAGEVARARPDWLVEHAHMELATPNFDAGIDALVTRGATSILVHLHFLGSGYHVRETIPQLVSKAQARHTQITIQTSTPLGQDPRIADLIVDRMDRHSVDDRQRSK